MYAENTLQMEWCLDCHRNPAKKLRPTSEIYNMAWEAPAPDRPVWCSVEDEQNGKPTAQSVKCVTKEPNREPGSQSAAYQKFSSQGELGSFLVEHYKIRKPNELASCEVCHR